MRGSACTLSNWGLVKEASSSSVSGVRLPRPCWRIPLSAWNVDSPAGAIAPSWLAACAGTMEDSSMTSTEDAVTIATSRFMIVLPGAEASFARARSMTEVSMLP